MFKGNRLHLLYVTGYLLSICLISGLRVNPYLHKEINNELRKMNQLNILICRFTGKTKTVKITIAIILICNEQYLYSF